MGDSERGVSEVISVLLMVSVTIVLAAMVGTVLLNIVSDVESSPVAGASAEFDAENNSIGVVYQANQNPNTNLSVTLYNSSGSDVGTRSLTEVGERAEFTGLSDGEYRVVVVAKVGSEQSVVLSKSGRV